MAVESMILVRPEHLNHHGFLYGGKLLEWLDEHSYIGAMAHLKPEASLVTKGIDRVEFRHQVRDGSLLKVRAQLVHVGHTSLTTYTSFERTRDPVKIFRALVTFVSLDKQGQPTPIAPFLLRPFRPQSAEERRYWAEVEAARSRRSAAGKPEVKKKKKTTMKKDTP
ncbi:MAG: acyl-CoA thioesterase [Planctomycetes bacterium]|nr:acyl-CoA thioesterase [Planctomycetota bacterium]